MPNIQNFQTLKRQLFLYRLGIPVENGEAIDEVYKLLQPFVSVYIKDGGGSESICHIDSKGKIIYFTFDYPNGKHRYLEISYKHRKIIEKKFISIVKLKGDYEYKEYAFQNIFSGYGIKSNSFCCDNNSALMDLFQQKYDMGDYRNIV